MHVVLNTIKKIWKLTKIGALCLEAPPRPPIHEPDKETRWINSRKNCWAFNIANIAKVISTGRRLTLLRSAWSTCSRGICTCTNLLLHFAIADLTRTAGSPQGPHQPPATWGWNDSQLEVLRMLTWGILSSYTVTVTVTERHGHLDSCRRTMSY